MATATKTPKQEPGNATAQFFEGLAERGHIPALAHTSGTIRVDVTGGQKAAHWYVTINKGDVTVTHKNAPADAEVQSEETLFDGYASGNLNLMVGLLRGVIDVGGDLNLLAMFEKVFPGPPDGGAATNAKQEKRP